MASLEEIKNLVVEKINALKLELNKLQQVYNTILQQDEIKTTATEMIVNNGNIGIVKNSLNNNGNNFSSKEFLDYNVEATFYEKAKYYATKLNRAFNCIEFKNFVIEREGEEKAMTTLTHNASSRFKLLLARRQFIAAKFGGSNRHTFYLLKEWQTEDKRDIKREFYPTPEAFGNLIVDKRCGAEIKWLDK